MTRFLPWSLALAFSLCSVWLVHRAWNIEADAARDAEASRLASEGQIVELRKTAADLQRDLDVEIESNTALQAALDEARKAAPGSKVVRMVRASTGPMPAGGQPRECPVPPIGTACPVCLVAPGDQLEVRVAEVDLQTKLGNRVVVGSGACVRLLPPPETTIAEGEFEASLTRVEELAPTPDKGWPWWANAAIGAGVGFVAGVMVAK